MMCSGRVDIQFVLRAFVDGVDGVFVVGCKLGECNYATQGNYYALSMGMLCKRLMEHLGVKPERLRVEFMSSADGIRFASVITEFSQTVRELGPLGEAEGVDGEELKNRIKDILRLVPYIKIAKRDKLRARLGERERYEELYTVEEIKNLLEEVPSYYIDPEKCQACGTCARRCPAGAIDGGKGKIHIIMQDKCIKCGTCLEACPPKFGAVQKLIGKPVPPPVPEEQRTIVRKAKKAN